jgi:energy-coupling factor transporter ATP-binding protein EcfA2
MTVIDKLTLINFRAFPGSEPVEFRLHGKNLLIYGENGSGKTSIFIALTEMLRHPAPRKGAPPTPWENVFAGADAGPWSVALDFTNQTRVVWTAAGVSGTSILEDDRLILGTQIRNEAALLSAALDYRSLLDTNYRHDEGEVNLFDVLVKRLLAGCGLTSPGVSPFPTGTAQVRIADYWETLLGLRRAIGWSSTSVPASILAACVAFNQGLNALLGSLTEEANSLLSMLGHPGLKIQPLICAGIRPVANHFIDKRVFEGNSISLKLMFQDHPKPVDRPQLFLNEARLTAIGLALYLAARKVVVSQSNLNGPKVLVLDDVLIGLDQANRIPVLDVLQQHFGEWQIVLLTHDRAFYEIGRQRLDSAKWVRQEIYAGRVGNFEKPLLVDDELDLYRALAYLDRGEIKAAAVHVRSAFERVLKNACCDLHVPVKYHHDPRKVPASELWAALSSKKYKTPAKACFGIKQGQPIRWITKEVDVSVVPQQLASRINHSVSWVLNPLSHSQTVDRYRREIEDAIYAVDELTVAVHRALQVQKTRPIELLQYLATALQARAVQLATPMTDTA